MMRMAILVRIAAVSGVAPSWGWLSRCLPATGEKTLVGFAILALSLSILLVASTKYCEANEDLLPCRGHILGEPHEGGSARKILPAADTWRVPSRGTLLVEFIS